MEVMILNRKNLKDILSMPDVIEGVREVYRLKAKEETAVWPHVIYDFQDPKGVMDIKSGFIKGDLMLHGAKMLNTFWGNQGTEVPVFNGLMMVFDSNTGAPLGMLDASYITGMRTGAAGALGVETFARKDSKKLLILGTGRQAGFQLAATLHLMPSIETVYVANVMSFENAKRFAEDMPKQLVENFNITDREYVKFVAAEDLEKAVRDSDAVITITPARSPIIKKEWLKPGTHLSCVGADMAGKEEIFPDCFVGAKIFADDKKQTMHIGEMEIPLRDGYITPEDVAGEIGQVLNGTLQGRTSEEEITIFDATGIALLDIVTAKIAIDKAMEMNIGTVVEM